MRTMMMGVALLAVFGATGLAAQNTTAGANASITIPELLHIDVSNTTVTFGTATLTNWDDGHIPASSAGSDVTTRANVVHDVTIEADAATMTTADGGTKTAGDLQWSTDGTTFVSLSETAADVLTALAAGANGGVARGTVTYRMLLSEETDEPGTYTLAFTYTVVAN